MFSFPHQMSMLPGVATCQTSQSHLTTVITNICALKIFSVDSIHPEGQHQTARGLNPDPFMCVSIRDTYHLCIEPWLVTSFFSVEVILLFSVSRDGW